MISPMSYVYKYLCPYQIYTTNQCGARTARAPHNPYTREVACWAVAQQHQVTDFPLCFFFSFSIVFLL
jgi:hypothetical protein